MCWWPRAGAAEAALVPGARVKGYRTLARLALAEILGTNVDPSAVTRIEQQIPAVRLDEANGERDVLWPWR